MGIRIGQVELGPLPSQPILVGRFKGCQRSLLLDWSFGASCFLWLNPLVVKGCFHRWHLRDLNPTAVFSPFPWTKMRLLGTMWRFPLRKSEAVPLAQRVSITNLSEDLPHTVQLLPETHLHLWFQVQSGPLEALLHLWSQVQHCQPKNILQVLMSMILKGLLAPLVDILGVRHWDLPLDLQMQVSSYSC